MICHICQTPISGYVGRFKGEPIHPSCRWRDEQEIAAGEEE